jgi:hypothetical protein
MGWPALFPLPIDKTQAPSRCTWEAKVGGTWLVCSWLVKTPEQVQRLLLRSCFWTAQCFIESSWSSEKRSPMIISAVVISCIGYLIPLRIQFHLKSKSYSIYTLKGRKVHGPTKYIFFIHRKMLESTAVYMATGLGIRSRSLERMWIRLKLTELFA